MTFHWNSNVTELKLQHFTKTEGHFRKFCDSYAENENFEEHWLGYIGINFYYCGNLLWTRCDLKLLPRPETKNNLFMFHPHTDQLVERQYVPL